MPEATGNVCMKYGIKNLVDSEKMVMFESKENLLSKIVYDLEHDEEWKRIVYGGN